MNDKFFGNTDRSLTLGFEKYFNQLTPDSCGKWGAVQPTTPTSFDWSRLDAMYAFARTHNIQVKQHCFVWGIDQPAWVMSLSPAEQKNAVENWIREFCTRYPDTAFIDVVNEPLHAPPPYAEALGGSGVTGWDWIITAYQMARKYAPNAKLLINEYGTMRYSTDRATLKTIIKLLQDRGLIDGIGLQAYTFDELTNTTPDGCKAAILDYKAMGLPVYISELSIADPNDASQLAKYQAYFPTFWDNCDGITGWGYIQGLTYEPDAYLQRLDGSPRPAFTWMLDYVKQQPLPPPVTQTCVRVTYKNKKSVGTGLKLREGPSMNNLGDGGWLNYGNTFVPLDIVQNSEGRFAKVLTGYPNDWWIAIYLNSTKITYATELTCP